MQRYKYLFSPKFQVTPIVWENYVTCKEDDEELGSRTGEAVVPVVISLGETSEGENDTDDWPIPFG